MTDQFDAMANFDISRKLAIFNFFLGQKYWLLQTLKIRKIWLCTATRRTKYRLLLTN
jgi:hypothetical protein